MCLFCIWGIIRVRRAFVLLALVFGLYALKSHSWISFPSKSKVLKKEKTVEGEKNHKKTSQISFKNEKTKEEIKVRESKKK